MKLPRHRTWFVFFAALTVLLVRTFTDTDGIFKSAAWIVEACTGIVVLTLCHWARKAYLDYGDDTDMRQLFAKAQPGHALVAIAIFFLAFALVFSGRANAQDLRTYLPPAAKQYLPTLGAELDTHWPDSPRRGYVAALIEHESGCFSMPRKCWNPKSRLKSAREEGAGFGQITRAYRADGSERFDALADLVDRFPALKGWTWANVYDRPDMQLRAVVIMTREGYQSFILVAHDADEALAFSDAAYNGGRAGLQKERRACGLKPGCDPGRWFGHVEHLCMKSRAPLYGSRSACDINRHHVHDVWKRAPKYEGLV